MDPSNAIERLSGAETWLIDVLKSTESFCGGAYSLMRDLQDPCFDAMLATAVAMTNSLNGMQRHDVSTTLEILRRALVPRPIQTDSRPHLGASDADVTVTVFMDFTCHRCKKFSQTVFELDERYGVWVKIVHKHAASATHGLSKDAARAAEVAYAQGRFWEMFGALYSHDLQETSLMDVASSAGLDAEEFAAAMLDEPPAVTDPQLREARRLQMWAFPAVFVNGRRVDDVLYSGSLDIWIIDALIRCSWKL